MYYIRDLICIRHCGKTMFAYDAPSKCPLCSKPVGDLLENMPFTIPCPFVRAYQYPCSVVLRSSIGDFLSSFQNNSHLHIGLTSSNGTTFEFDVGGIVRTPPIKDIAKDDWNQCILVAQVPEAWHDRWDEVLEQVSTDNLWSSENYHDESHNCYTFVLNFLKALDFEEYAVHCQDKISFSKRVVAPRTQNAAKYITIHRKLQTSGYFIEE